MLETAPSTNTDSNEVRQKRGVNQFRYEDTALSSCTSQPVSERYRIIREAIFKGIEDVKGVDPTEIHSKGQLHEYPSRKLVREIYQPEFWEFVDHAYEEINTLKDPERSSMGFRLAAVTYCLGVIIHHAEDGNGQTYKLLTLSYLRELCAGYSAAMIPIKYDSENNRRNIMAWNSTGLNNLIVAPPAEMYTNEIDRKLYSMLFRSPFKNEDEEYNLGPEEWRENMERMAQQLADEIKSLGLPINTDLGTISPLIRIGNNISSYLAQKYPGYRFSRYPKSLDKAAKKEYALITLFRTSAGREFLVDYIRGNKATFSSEIEEENEALKTLHEIFVWFEIELERVVSAEEKVDHHLDMLRQVL